MARKKNRKNSNGYARILSAIQKQNDSIGAMMQAMGNVNTNVGTLKTEFEGFKDIVRTHEKILRGIPEQGGKGGLMNETAVQRNEIDGLKESVDKVRSIYAPVWTAICGIVSAVIAGIVSAIMAAWKAIKGG